MTDDLGDLTTCDREPIHIPGAVQPYGVLLSVDPATRRIVQVSESAPALLGRDLSELTHERLDALLGDGATDVLERLLARDAAGGEAIRIDVRSGSGVRAFDVAAFRTEDLMVVELEPASVLSPAELDALLTRLRNGVARIQATTTVMQTCDAVLDEFVSIAGFDRTMVYRFDRDWHGEVIGEHLSDDAQPPYLGLHYPATDIPRQARDLFTRNIMRAIPDSAYAPARIVPAENPRTGRPLDLSRSKLRAASPIHLEYMQNMGTAASMTASLLRNDRLWGMIAAHHRTPRHVPYRLRVACELIARAASLQITAIEEREEFAYRLRMRALQPELIQAIDREGEFVRAIAERGEVLEIAGAQGAALKAEGEPVLVGSTPSMRDVRRIIAWLEKRGGSSDEPFVTDELPILNPEFAGLKDVASGLLAVPLTTSRGGWMLWFRPEAVRTVRWGGDPTKTPDEFGRLSPRKSFDVWKETVRLHSHPWLAAQVDATIELRRLVSDVMMRRAREYAALNAELARSNAELESFAYVASHDLKEPLRGLSNYATFLTQDYSDVLDERGRDMLASMSGLVNRMEGQIESMLQLARAGSLDIPAEPIELDAALDAALELLAPRLAEEQATIVRPDRLPAVLMNAVQARELFLNLVGNGLKYNESEQKTIAIAVEGRETERDVPLVTISVRDNGIGIAEKYLDTIFVMFKRLHAQNRYGGGTGAGLAIARKIVETSGGTLTARSVAGEGTTFFFTVPEVSD